MMHRVRVSFVVAAGCLLAASASWAQSAADHAAKLDEFLQRGQLAESLAHFEKVVADRGDDHPARTALGLTQFLQAVEWLGQTNYRYGLINKHAQWLPIARMPIPINESPAPIVYDEMRSILQGFERRLKLAEATLAAVDTSQVKLDFYVGRVRLDLDGNGKLSDEETLWRIFSAISQGVQAEQGEGFSIGLDGADVHWLRGYCHVLVAFCDVILAYDERDLFERCGHLLFLKVETPFRVTREAHDQEDLWSTAYIADLIAAIHLVRFPLVEPERMESAHEHLLAMIRQSRLCWERALAETDNDREWIPNADQESVAQTRVPREMITGWHTVLDELEAILEGRKLIPFWRTYYRDLFGQAEIPEHGTGVNLKKFFLEPLDFDLVLTIQGTNMEPYLEEGPLSTPESWDRLTRVFRGQFFGFALWFN